MKDHPLRGRSGHAAWQQHAHEAGQGRLSSRVWVISRSLEVMKQRGIRQLKRLEMQLVVWRCLVQEVTESSSSEDKF